MGKVIFHPAARAELLAAAEYYEQCRGGLGKEFLAAVENTVSCIKLYPDSGCMLRHPFKRFLVTRFPFGVIYREAKDGIFIAAIMHLSRRPGYWMSRVGLDKP